MIYPKVYYRRGRWGFQWFRNGRFCYGTNSFKRWLKYGVLNLRKGIK